MYLTVILKAESDAKMLNAAELRDFWPTLEDTIHLFCSKESNFFKRKQQGIDRKSVVPGGFAWYGVYGPCGVF